MRGSHLPEVLIAEAYDDVGDRAATLRFTLHNPWRCEMSGQGQKPHLRKVRFWRKADIQDSRAPPRAEPRARKR